MSDYASALFLGLIEGITEYLPVSSTGHLVLFGDVIGFTGPTAKTFEVFIQLGAILAVVILFWGRFCALLNFSSGQRRTVGFVGLQGIIKLAVACFPALLIGFLFHKSIKELLFAPVPVALALVIGGLFMLLVESRNREARVTALENLSLKDAFIVGLCQCFALWPGISRSGSTIIGGMLFGVSRAVAAEFSFLLAVPMLCVAVAYDLLKNISLLSTADIPIFGIGFVVAFLSALLSVRIFVDFLQRYSLRLFGYYRIILGLLVLIFFST